MGERRNRKRALLQQTGLLELRLPMNKTMSGLVGITTDAVSEVKAGFGMNLEFSGVKESVNGLVKRKVSVRCSARDCAAGVFMLDVGEHTTQQNVDLFEFDFASHPGGIYASHSSWFGRRGERVPRIVAFRDVESYDGTTSDEFEGREKIKMVGPCQALIVSPNHFVISFQHSSSSSGSGNAAARTAWSKDDLVTVLSARRRPSNDWSIWSKVAMLIIALIFPIYLAVQKSRRSAKDAMLVRRKAAEIRSLYRTSSSVKNNGKGRRKKR